MKESTASWAKAIKQAQELEKKNMLSKKDMATLKKIADLMKSANESIHEGDVEDALKKYVKNPYGIGAQRVNDEGKFYSLLFSDSNSREETIKKLRKKGILAKKMRKMMQPKGMEYRYELVLHKESFNEALPSPPLKLSKSQIKGMIRRAKKAGAKGYDIIVSLSRDLSITSDEVVSTLEKHRLIGMTEENTMKENKFKSAIRDRIKVELRKNLLRMEDEDSVADSDMKTAQKLRKPLRNAIEGVSNSVDNINKMMSSFNAPGLRVAFLYEIKKNINTQTQKFDMRGALKDFEDYFKDR